MTVYDVQTEHVNITQINIMYQKVTYKEYEEINYPVICYKVSKESDKGPSSPI